MKILSLAAFLSLQNPALAQKFAEDEKIIISAIEDYKLKNSTFLKCEAGSLNIILALLAKKISSQKEFFQELDEAFLYSEANLDEEDIEELGQFLEDCELIIIDSSYKEHKDRKNIESLLAIISQAYKIKIISTDEEELKFKEESLEELKLYDSFNGITLLKLKEAQGFLGSRYFATINNLQDGESYNIISPSLNVKATFKIDENLKGSVAILEENNKNSYIYEIAKISKV